MSQTAEYKRVWRKANPEKVQAQQQRYRERHPERIKATNTRQNKARYASLKRFLRSVKETAGCIDCGYAENVAALQFDHVRGVKEFTVHSAGSIRRAVGELMKCEVRCANCHAIKTAERIGSSVG